MHRFYVSPENWDPQGLALRASEAHHARNVLRMQAGDKLVLFNGEGREIAPGSTVSKLLGELGVTQPHVAVEVNLEVIPRAEHRETTLSDGDRVEVVTLVGGG